MNRTIAAELAALAAEGNFDRFVASTRAYWAHKAEAICRCSGYAGTTPDDLVQEMLAALWEELPGVDPTKGDPARFLMWRAHTAATRYLAHSRGLVRNGAKGWVGCALEPVDSFDEGALVDTVDPERTAAARTEIELYLRHATPRDRVLVSAALDCGDTAEGAKSLCQDTHLSEELGFKHPDPVAVRRAIRRAVVRTINSTEI